MLPDCIEYVPEAQCWVLRNDEGICREIRRRGRLDWDELYNALDVWHRSTTGWVLDIGAYIGDTIPPMLRAGYSVIAVECQPDAFLCLSLNHPQVEKHLMAAGNWELVSLSQGAGGDMGARSLGQGGDRWAVGLAGLIGPRTIKVIKLDVEGYEAKVLAGMEEVLVRDRPIVIIESNWHALNVYGNSEQNLWQYLPNYRRLCWQHTESDLWDYICYPV